MPLPPPLREGVTDSNREEVRGSIGRVAGSFGVRCGYGSPYVSVQYHYGRSRDEQNCDDTDPKYNDDFANNNDPTHDHSCRYQG